MRPSIPWSSVVWLCLALVLAAPVAAQPAAPAAPDPAAMFPVPKLAEPEELGKLPGEPICLSPDGKWIVVRSEKDAILCDAEDGHEVRRFTGHTETVNGIEFSPDGKQLVTGGSDSTVRLWDVESGALPKVLVEGGGDVFGTVQWSPDGQSVAALDITNEGIWIIAVGGGEPRKVAWPFDYRGTDMAFSPDSQTLAAVADEWLVLWDVATLTKRARASVGDETQVAYGPAGDFVATWGRVVDPNVRLRDPVSGNQMLSLYGAGDQVKSVAFSPGGGEVAVCRGESNGFFVGVGGPVVSDPRTGSTLAKLEGGCRWMSFLPAGGRLLGWDGTRLLRWDLSALSDPEQRAAFEAYYDGERDQYARYLRRCLPEQHARPLEYLGSRAGQVVVRITDPNGVTLEGVGVSIGETGIGAGALTMVVGAAKIDVELTKLKAIEVLGARSGGFGTDYTAGLKLSALDGSETAAQLSFRGSSHLSGTGTYGSFSLAIAKGLRMELDFEHAREPAEPAGAPEDAPFAATVTTSSKQTIEASDIKLTDRHVLPLYVGRFRLAIDFRHLKAAEVLARVPHGALVRASLAGDRELVGYVSYGEMSEATGSMALGRFHLPGETVQSIVFK